MRPSGNALRSTVIRAALDQAILGKDQPLIEALCQNSGLPGTRANLALAEGFAEECAYRGAACDKLLIRFASIHPDRAPGGTALEFLPLCAAMGLGARAAKDAKVREYFVEALHDLSEDLRFRVRDAVPIALSWIGRAAGPTLLDGMEKWSEGLFHVRALLLALADREWLATFQEPDAVIQVMESGFKLLINAPRAIERYPGYKALVDALNVVPGVFAARFGACIPEALAQFANVKEPKIREIIEKNIKFWQTRLPDEARVLKLALAKSAPIPRDPTIVRKGMRRRGKK